MLGEVSGATLKRGVYFGRSRSRFQRTRMSLNSNVVVKRPHMSGKSSVEFVEYQSHLSIQSLHSFRPCSSAASLLLKTGPSIRLTSTSELSRRGRKIIPCEYQSKPVAKDGTGELVIKKSLYRSISHCLTIIAGY